MNQLAFRAYTYIQILLIMLLNISCLSPKVQISKLSNRGSSRATAYIEQNKIANYNDSVSYVTFLGNENGLFNIQILKETPAETKYIKVIDSIEDNHGGASVILDKEGFIHLVHSGHHSSLYHLKSKSPHKIEEWVVVDSINGNFTYPTVSYNSTKNEMYLTAREWAVNNIWSANFYKKSLDYTDRFEQGGRLIYSNNKRWKQDGEKLNYSNNGYVRWNKSVISDGQNRLFYLFRNYEYLPSKLEFNYLDEKGGGAYFVSYVWSDNNGIDWYSGNSKKKSFFPEDLDIISGDFVPRATSGHHHISNPVFFEDQVYFGYSKVESHGQHEFYLATFNFKGTVKSIKVNYKSTDYVVLGPAALKVDQKGNFYFLASAVPSNKFCNCLKDWGREDNILMLLGVNKKGKIFLEKEITKEFILDEIDERLTGFKGPIWLPATEFYKNSAKTVNFVFTAGDKGVDLFEKVNNFVFLLTVSTLDNDK